MGKGVQRYLICSTCSSCVLRINLVEIPDNTIINLMLDVSIYKLYSLHTQISIHALHSTTQMYAKFKSTINCIELRIHLNCYSVTFRGNGLHEILYRDSLDSRSSIIIISITIICDAKYLAR